MRRLEQEITPDLDGLTVEAVARREMHLSRHTLTRAKYLDDGIVLDGRRVRSNMRVRAGQLLSIAIGDGDEACAVGRVEPIPGTIDIVFEDDDVIVLEKPAGIVMYPYEGIGEPTLGNHLMHYLCQQAANARGAGGVNDGGGEGGEGDEGGDEGADRKGDAGADREGGMGGEGGLRQGDGCAAANAPSRASKHAAPCRLHPVHRLDRGTSGLVVFAKNAHAQHILQKALHTDAFTREYRAVCHGAPQPERGAIDAPIARAGYRPASFCVRDDGKPACTHYALEATGTVADGQRISLVRLRLETGRTHQIRVHMASIGCPLLGDEIYGGSTGMIARPALHSTRLSFVHPITGERIDLQTDPPADMRLLMELLDKR